MEFELEATATKDNLTITSKDLTTQDLHVRAVDFSSLEEKQNTQDEGIILLKLGPGQRIKFTATAKLVRKCDSFEQVDFNIIFLGNS